MRQLDELSRYACNGLREQAGVSIVSPLAYKQWIRRSKSDIIGRWTLESPILAITPPTSELGCAVIWAKASTTGDQLSSDGNQLFEKNYGSDKPTRATSTALRFFNASDTKFDHMLCDDINNAVSTFDAVCSAGEWTEEVLASGVKAAGREHTRKILGAMGDDAKRLAGCLTRYEDAKAICSAINFINKTNDASAFLEEDASESLMMWVLDRRLLPTQFFRYFQSRYAGPDGFWNTTRNVTPSKAMRRQFAVSYERLSRVVLKHQKATTFEFTPSEIQ